MIGDREIRKMVMSTLNKVTLSRRKGQEGALTRQFTRRVAVALHKIARLSTDAAAS